MKKREITLRWNKYEVGDLVRSTDKRSGLEPGLVYEVTEFLGPYTTSICDPHFSGGVCLVDEEGNLRVTSAEWVRPANWWIEIRIDETRDWHWDILNAILGKEGKVYGVYIYNEMEHTNCCEIKPSFFLKHVYDYTSIMLPEKMMDEFEAASHIEGDGHYFHTTDIDALPESDKFELGIFGCLGETSEEIEEQIQEHVQGNPNWC